MTTDITELAQSLKAAAEKAIGANERLSVYKNDEIIDISQHEGEQIDIDIADINLFLGEANPANILTLVEALEKAQQVDEELCNLLPPGVEYMDPPDGGDVTPLEGVRRMVADYRQLIAELESRTVKLPKPHAHLIWIQAGHAPDDYWDDVAVSHSEKDRCCDGSERYPVYARWEIEEMMSAAGIKVEAE